MIERRDAQLLSEQLLEAVAAQQVGEGDLFEVAVLGGLLSRHQPRAAAAVAAERLLAGLDLTSVVPDSERQDAQVDRLAQVEEDDLPTERIDVLLDLDELCAGAWFCGHAEAVADTIDLAVRTIDGFPDPWRDLAGFASTVLQRAPPHREDPARRLWRAVEAAPWQEDPAEVPACLTAQQKLALVPSASLAWLTTSAYQGGAAIAFQASGSLPPQAVLIPLLTTAQYEVALTLDPQVGRALLLKLTTADEPLLQHDGEELHGVRLAPGLWRFPAQVGRYHLVIAGDEHPFEVTE